MSWEKDYTIELICPKCGVIAKYEVYSDDWLRTEERWIFGRDMVEKIYLKNVPYKEHIVYKCKKCGSICEEKKL